MYKNSNTLAREKKNAKALSQRLVGWYPGAKENSKAWVGSTPLQNQTDPAGRHRAQTCNRSRRLLTGHSPAQLNRTPGQHEAVDDNKKQPKPRHHQELLDHEEDITRRHQSHFTTRRQQRRPELDCSENNAEAEGTKGQN